MAGIPSSGNCVTEVTCSIASFKEIALFGSRFTSRITAIVLMAVACARPRIETLPGAPARSRQLPPSPVLTGHRKVVFQWELKDQDMTARGDGVARIAYPDSV